MPLNPSFVGRSYAFDTPFLVGREHIRQFARAIGDMNPFYHDLEVAKTSGYPDLLAPPTFLAAAIPGKLGVPTEDPALGLDYSLIVHAEQRFTLRRPVVAGDELVAVGTISSTRVVGQNEVLTTTYEFSSTGGEPVATGVCKLVSRGTAPPKEG
jgi:acyl dehydratase